MTTIAICLAALILGPLAFAALDHAARQAMARARRERRHRQTIRSLFAPCDHRPSGCAHYTRRRDDALPRHRDPLADPDLGPLPRMWLPQQA
jgi:hypothetical protein